MGRFQSLRSVLSPRSWRSRLVSRIPPFPASTRDRSSVVDSKHQGGILLLFRAISHIRFPGGSNFSGGCIPFLYLDASLSLKRHFHATGVLSQGSNYYEILGVPKDSSQEDIKKAFHNLAKKFHPDANKHNPASKKKFQEIREAYETLRDTDKRAQYDVELSGDRSRGRYSHDGSTGFKNQNRGPFSDSFYNIFSEIFEDDRETYANDIQVELQLSFHEAAKGCNKSLSFSANLPCDSCGGRGHPVDAKVFVCSVCGGTGRVTVIPFTSRCNSCRGLGRIVKDHCLKCSGAGVMKQTKSVDVSIPAGVDSGDTIRVLKAGNSGGPGVHPGNLFIKLKVAKDPIFSRDGADIYVDSNISFTQAILGGTVEVATLSGKTEVKIPKGVQPGQLSVLRGRGLPSRTGFTDCGDQYVRFCIHFPHSVNDRQKALLEEFSREEEILEREGYQETKRWHPSSLSPQEKQMFFYVAIAVLILAIHLMP